MAMAARCVVLVFTQFHSALAQAGKRTADAIEYPVSA